MSDINNNLVLEPEVEDIIGDVQPVAPGLLQEPVFGDGTVPESNPVANTPEQFFGTLQNAMLNVWRFHLSTKRHFEHVELERTYHVLLSITDRLVEMYQGHTGIVIDPAAYFNVLNTPTDSISCLIELRDYVRATSKEVFSMDDFSELFSTVDELLTELDVVIYKLQTFKEEPIQTFEQFTFAHEQEPLNEGCDCGGDDCDDCNDDEEEE